MMTADQGSGPSETRRKLLDAAAQVFARSGLEGATTREIARVAGVNEVTLFRHFQTKDKLLGAVLQSTFSGPEEALGAPAKPASSASAAEAKTPPLPAPTDLRGALRAHITRYEELLRQHILLVRTLIGDIHRHHEHEARVLKGIFHPLKADLVATIRAGLERGEVRPEIDPVVATDLLASMVFMDVLRRTSHLVPTYPAPLYQNTMLDVFVRGIEPPAAGPAGAALPPP